MMVMQSMFVVISTHTLTWSVTHVHAPYSPVAPISTHTLTWSVTQLASLVIVAPLDFNSHAHVERDEMCIDFAAARYNFNSHAHVERDISMMLIRNFSAISTHTLTWSVTRQLIIINILKNISTHTLTWSVTGCRPTL